MTIPSLRAPDPIFEGGFVDVGGEPHWVAIRGQDRRNPVLLVLHGPGGALSPLAPLFEPWERNFTVAHWDQPGAGATFARNGEASLSLQRPSSARSCSRSASAPASSCTGPARSGAATPCCWRRPAPPATPGAWPS